eukprot:TRINITY_DN2192_c0_g1_i1.p1 TRINITY_DN2192_c0_g1~~TRINITY_DN2192_c0_g1_i1.p1  ORF type:complete len:111 (+),score=13.79 TRINITY_DN2192_c0_g1_i1:36-335(+)
MVERMHTAKIKQMEEFVYYRENSVRYINWMRPKMIASFVGIYFLLPYLAHKFMLVTQQAELDAKGIPHNFRTVPGWKPYNNVKEGPEQMLEHPKIWRSL